MKCQLYKCLNMAKQLQKSPTESNYLQLVYGLRKLTGEELNKHAEDAKKQGYTLTDIDNIFDTIEDICQKCIPKVNEKVQNIRLNRLYAAKGIFIYNKI